MSKIRKMHTYSEAFKQKVVKEIENGKLTISEAEKIYDIGGRATIYRWVQKLGKSHLINRVVHIQMKDEKSKIKELEKQRRELESALANAHLKIITLESTITVLSEREGKGVKKKRGIKSYNSVLKTKDSKGENTK
ncbi:MAG: transposase [Chlorobi bacterium]|nr:transposase [Chlorobiota bacterium]